jgi:Asp-tRNA(Asn)/Glu-tRNA(Gln) amidotransferase A subunit family amidase
MDTLDLDTIVYPSGTPYNTNGSNMRLSPNTGMPAITVPMGQTAPSDGSDAIANAGINLEFLGRDYAEGTIIGLGYAFEQATHFRTTPALYPALG